MANELRAAAALKRGGGATFVPLEARGDDGAPRERPIADANDLDAEFQREWARSLFALAVEALEPRCRGTRKELAFALFERYDLEGAEAAERPSYAAPRRGATACRVTQVTNHLHWARRELRAEVLETLREITASEEEFRAEARALLGVDPP